MGVALPSPALADGLKTDLELRPAERGGAEPASGGPAIAGIGFGDFPEAAIQLNPLTWTVGTSVMRKAPARPYLLPC